MKHSFTTDIGLRRLLIRLRVTGHLAWKDDPEASALMEYVKTKYSALAAKHHCSPDSAASTAFEAMTTYAVRRAVQPWAVVTQAVRVSLIAEERADGLMCSIDQARRPEVSQHHDVRRFSDTEVDLPNLLPSLAVDPFNTAAPRPTGAFEAVDKAIELFVLLGWPDDTATCALDYIASRLVECGSRATAHSYLRRDLTAQAFLDIERSAWTTVLRIVLGNPHPDTAWTSDGHGVLLRFMIGHPISELLLDDLLVLEISHTAPKAKGRVDA